MLNDKPVEIKAIDFNFKNDKGEFEIRSIDFLNHMINPMRKESGEREVSNKDFCNRIVDEIDDISNKEIFLLGKTGHKIRCYSLNHDDAMLIGMRESKGVRKLVLAKLKEMSAELEKLKKEKQDPLALFRILLEQAEAERDRVNNVEVRVDTLENTVKSYVSIYEIMPKGYASEKTILAKYCPCVSSGKFKEAVIAFGVKTQTIFGVDAYNATPQPHRVYSIEECSEMYDDLMENSIKVSKARWVHPKLIGTFLLKV